jgi:hypothetical protein
MRNLTFLFLLLVIKSILSSDSNSESDSAPGPEKQFVFPEFDYVQSSKNEIAYKEWMTACQQTPQCLGIQSDLSKIRCVRKCISPSCYYEIYSFDELEPGEIDVRFGSFKGCFIQRLARRRRV